MINIMDFLFTASCSTSIFLLVKYLLDNNYDIKIANNIKKLNQYFITNIFIAYAIYAYILSSNGYLVSYINPIESLLLTLIIYFLKDLISSIFLAIFDINLFGNSSKWFFRKKIQVALIISLSISLFVPLPVTVLGITITTIFQRSVFFVLLSSTYVISKIALTFILDKTLDEINTNDLILGLILENNKGNFAKGISESFRNNETAISNLFKKTSFTYSELLNMKLDKDFLKSYFAHNTLGFNNYSGKLAVSAYFIYSNIPKLVSLSKFSMLIKTYPLVVIPLVSVTLSAFTIYRLYKFINKAIDNYDVSIKIETLRKNQAIVDRENNYLEEFKKKQLLEKPNTIKNEYKRGKKDMKGTNQNQNSKLLNK